MIMRKWFTEIIVILGIILLILAIVYIPRIFGAQPGMLSKDLVAIAVGIPITLLMIFALGLLARLWDYTLGKIIIIAAVILIIVICAIIF